MSTVAHISDRPPGYPDDLPWVLPPAQNLLSALEQAAIQYADRRCLDYFGRKFTYREVWNKSLSMATYLQKLGVKEGGRVFVVLPNMPEAVIAILGTFLCGAVVVMGNPISSESEHAFQWTDSDAHLVVTLDVLADRFHRVAKSLKRPSIIIAASLTHSMSALKSSLAKWFKKVPIVTSFSSPDVVRFAYCMKSEAAVLVPRRNAHELAALLYTGGTTGTPKAVMLNWSNLSANVGQISIWLAALSGSDTRVLAVFPFFSAAGLTALLLNTLVNGGQLVLLPRPDSSSIAAALKRLRIDVLPGVPTIYRGLLNDARFKRRANRLLRDVKIFLSGAAPLDERTQADWTQLSAQPIYELYGMTETSAMAFGNRPGIKIKPGSVGLPLPGLECRIVRNDSSRVVNFHEIGEVWLRGPQITQAYLNRPDDCASTFHDGWLKTGDLGYLDEDGFLFLKGRKKEMVISSGYNVYPKEVEEAILLHESVAECACIGVSDPYRGEALHAYVTFKPGCTVTIEELFELCGQRLAKYKLPQRFQVVDSMPKNSLGKIQKALLPNLDTVLPTLNGSL